LPVLQDRFGLKYHHEIRDLQVYTLVVAKGGPKLKQYAPPAGGDSPPAASMPPPPPPPPPPGPGGAPSGGGAMGPGGANGPRTLMRMSAQGMTMNAVGTTMASLSQMISQQLGATVVDKTGLAGKYDFTLNFAPDPNGGMPMMRPPSGPAPDGAASQEPVGPSLFAAVQEQLGLKLVAERQAVDVIVIDRIEQPTEN
jgi:uncharacterized protein (TIGR03435 family)